MPGRSVHGSARASGVSALDAAIPVLAALAELEHRRNASPPAGFAHLDLTAPLSVGTITAGEWASTVPDRLVAHGRYGVLPGEPVHEARAALEGAVALACASDPWLAGHPARVDWVGGQFASGSLTGSGSRRRSTKSTSAFADALSSG